MFSRIRVVFGIALLLALLTFVNAFAKGSYSFITITGSNLKEAVRVTDPALTTDFFAFADFSQDRTKAPANPGSGYEVTRYYKDALQETAFDRLHYYPYTGFVYYDGIVNGSSEYDGKWYIARPEMKGAFEKVLPGQVQPVAPAAQPPVTSEQSTLNVSISRSSSVLLVAVAIGIAAALMFALWLRKPSAR